MQILVTLLAWLVLSSPLYSKNETKLAAKKTEKVKPETGNPPECAGQKYDIRSIKRSDVYKDVVYGQGERSEYEVKYGGTLIGTGFMEVRKPVKFKGRYKKRFWHRSFHAEGKTGDWYKYIFVAHDKLDSLARPRDNAVSKFYMEQDEGQMFGRRFQKKKWLEFDHKECEVYEKSQRKGRGEKNETFEMGYGAHDTLGIAFTLRNHKYEVGKKVRYLIYSSQQSWWLEAMPLAIEDLKIAAGKYKAVKLKLQTYIGQELQQKGDVHIWIDQGTPQHPLLLIKAEIKIGSVWIEMTKFKPGR